MKSHSKIDGKSSSKEVSTLLFYSEQSHVDALYHGLVSGGYSVLDRFVLNDELLSLVTRYRPELIVVCVHTLDEGLLQTMSLLNQEYPLPVVIFAERDAPKIIEQVIRAGVSAYVVNDLQTQRLPSIIRVAMVRFNEFKRLREELDKTKIQLAGRKVLERAKGLLMKHHDINEEDAYVRLRKMSMDKGVSLDVVAQNVIDVLVMLEKQ